MRWNLWKKNIAAILIALVFLLCGCSLSSTDIVSGDSIRDDSDNDYDTNNDSDKIDDIETLKGWSFQYNVGTNDYSLFFGLLDSNDQYIARNVDVDIRIVNDAKEDVYSATKAVTIKDFGYYESQIAGERYLANIRISASDIKNGKSNNGTVYFIVYKDDTILFDEVNCDALYCLPVADVTLMANDLPVDLKVKGYDGSTESIIEIVDVSYSYEKEYVPQLKITFSGQKISGNSSSYDIISYKLYDADEYLIDSGNVYLKSLDTGDKFRDESIVIYDVTPGENYILQFTEYSWWQLRK